LMIAATIEAPIALRALRFALHGFLDDSGHHRRDQPSGRFLRNKLGAGKKATPGGVAL